MYKLSRQYFESQYNIIVTFSMYNVTATGKVMAGIKK